MLLFFYFGNLECGGALLRRFGLDCFGIVVACPKQNPNEKPKRRSKTPPHSRPKPEQAGD
jgi:hypothetical protein